MLCSAGTTTSTSNAGNWSRFDAAVPDRARYGCDEGAAIIRTGWATSPALPWLGCAWVRTSHTETVRPIASGTISGR